MNNKTVEEAFDRNRAWKDWFDSNAGTFTREDMRMAFNAGDRIGYERGKIEGAAHGAEIGKAEEREEIIAIFIDVSQMTLTPLNALNEISRRIRQRGDDNEGNAG